MYSMPMSGVSRCLEAQCAEAKELPVGGSAPGHVVAPGRDGGVAAGRQRATHVHASFEDKVSSVGVALGVVAVAIVVGHKQG